MKCKVNTRYLATVFEKKKKKQRKCPWKKKEIPSGSGMQSMQAFPSLIVCRKDRNGIEKKKRRLPAIHCWKENSEMEEVKYGE